MSFLYSRPRRSFKIFEEPKTPERLYENTQTHRGTPALPFRGSFCCKNFQCSIFERYLHSSSPSRIRIGESSRNSKYTRLRQTQVLLRRLSSWVHNITMRPFCGLFSQDQISYDNLIFLLFTKPRAIFYIDLLHPICSGVQNKIKNCHKLFRYRQRDRSCFVFFFRDYSVHKYTYYFTHTYIQWNFFNLNNMYAKRNT